MVNKEVDDKIVFSPKIINNFVISLKINDIEVNLRENIELQEFSNKLLPLLSKLNKYFKIEDLINMRSKSSLQRIEWNINNLEQFWSKLNIKQEKLVKIIYSNHDISRLKLVNQIFEINDNEETKIYVKKLAGISASVTRRWNNNNLQPIWKINRDKYVFNNIIKKVFDDFFSRGDR